MDVMNDFVNFGDDQADTFMSEYATTMHPCDGTPSSDDVDLNPLENSTSALLDTQQHGSVADFGISASLGSAWAEVDDSFSHMQVKAEPIELEISSAFAVQEGMIPGSWPSSQTALKSHAHTTKAAKQIQPASFNLSQIAPPSLPQERSNASSVSTLYSEKDEARDPSEISSPARKRRASETVRKASTLVPKQCHKRSTSCVTTDSTREHDVFQVSSVAEDVDESGDPVAARRQDRLMRNRAAALASRERKREHVMRLETSVADLESANVNLHSQVHLMYTEIVRLKKVLSDNNVTDHACSISSLDDIGSFLGNPSSTSLSNKLSANRARTTPTGFSPRGALKKEEIIANQIRAEEHLRNVTEKLSRTNTDLVNDEVKSKPSPSAKIEPAVEDKTLPVTTQKYPKTANSGGSVVFMILIFGIALFAHTNSSGAINLTGLSSDSGGSGLVLNIPHNMHDVCPETVISQLRGQGFMLSEELEDLQVRNLLTADTRAASTTPTLQSEARTTNLIADHALLSQHAAGAKFTIATPRTEDARNSDAQSSHINHVDWRMLDCEVKKVFNLGIDDV